MTRASLDDVTRLITKPHLSMVVVQLLTLFKDPHVGNADIKRVLAYDPEFASRVVQVSQAIAEKSDKKVNDLNMAVNFLGFESLKSVVLLVGFMKAFPETKGALRFQIDRFWRHSLASAIAYRYLARDRGVNVDVAFLCGIFHDIGKLIINQVLPSEMEQLMIMAERTQSYIHQVESLVLDTHHGEVGAWLAQSWGVDDEIVYYICNHHKEDKADSIIFSIGELVDYLLFEIGLISPGSYGNKELAGSILDQLELKNADLRQLERELKSELILVNYVLPEQEI